MAESAAKRPGRNEPCHCGSGKKYKHCCLARDEEEELAAQERRASAAPQPAPAEDAPASRTPPPPRAVNQPWKDAGRRMPGSRRITTPRKAG
jgi:SEC-C motif